MAEKRKGRQTPTQSLVLPYEATKGLEAVELYNRSGRTALGWQELLCSDIMATNEEGLWIHQKFGYSVPRRNGKNEIVAIRDLQGAREWRKNVPHRLPPYHHLSLRLGKAL